MTNEQIQEAYTYHTPKGDQSERYERVRANAKVLAMTIQACCPDSREKDQALVNLEQATMWANKAIAVNG